MLWHEADFVDDFWKRIVNWELVRGFGQSRLATISMAIPFVGFVILYHARIEGFLGELGATLNRQELDLGAFSDDNVPSDAAILSLYARINLIYVGSVLIGLATILYRLTAPTTVKNYASMMHFVDGELSRATVGRLRSMMETVKKYKPQAADELFKISPWVDKGHCSLKIAVGEMRANQNDHLQVDILSNFYNIESCYRLRLAVFLIFGIYSIGFTLLAIPGVLFTYRVLRVIAISAWSDLV